MAFKGTETRQSRIHCDLLDFTDLPRCNSTVRSHSVFLKYSHVMAFFLKVQRPAQEENKIPRRLQSVDDCTLWVSYEHHATLMESKYQEKRV